MCMHIMVPVLRHTPPLFMCTYISSTWNSPSSSVSHQRIKHVCLAAAPARGNKTCLQFLQLLVFSFSFPARALPTLGSGISETLVYFKNMAWYKLNNNHFLFFELDCKFFFPPDNCKYIYFFCTLQIYHSKLWRKYKRLRRGGNKKNTTSFK